MVAIYRTFPSVTITGRFDEEMMSVLGKEGVGVKFVCHNGRFGYRFYCVLFPCSYKFLNQRMGIWQTLEFVGRRWSTRYVMRNG